MRTTRLLTAGLSFALVLGVVAWEWRHLTSPGPLHPSHESVRELKGSAGCAACHGANASAMTGACVACHSGIGEQMRTAKGIHGSLGAAAAAACGACHGEHAGASLPLVSAQTFRLAGVADPDSYDHWHVAGFNLTGRHQEVACEGCHTLARAPQLAAGDRRFMGLTLACASCHKDPHEGSFGQACATCHGQAQAFKEAPDFVHDSFKLEGAHAGPACVKCHEASGPSAVGTLLSASAPPRACAACHDDAHKGSLGNDCASCHGTEKPFNQAALFKHTEKFPLIDSHAGIACRECHASEGAYSVQSLQAAPMPTRTCADCHASPHRAALITGVANAGAIPESGTCNLCHSSEHRTFLGPAATMTAAQHRATGFALDAPHDQVDCAKCHKSLGQRERLNAGPDLSTRFAQLYPGRTPQECRACHEDPHAGQFDTGPTAGRCIACHEATHFEPANFDLAAHARSRFPLNGAHRAVACSLCHKLEQNVRRFAPTPTACTACHKDVHEGGFDTPDRPKTVAGRVGCARCHNEDGFAQITWNADAHKLWTGYELRGGHASAACTDCHKRLSRPDKRGRTLSAAPTACNACHTDPHAGQFVRQGVNDCATCHDASAKFQSTTFDHQRDSSFVLDEHHAALSCAACHKPVRMPSGAQVIRYRPLGSKCQDCHGNQVPKGGRGS